MNLYYHILMTIATPMGLRVAFSYIPMRKEGTPTQASHRAGFFYFTTKEVFRWLTIKRVFPALGR